MIQTKFYPHMFAAMMMISCCVLLFAGLFGYLDRPATIGCAIILFMSWLYLSHEMYINRRFDAA